MPLDINVDLFKQDQAALDAFLQSWIGEKMNTGGTNVAPDPVNMPMIRHWIDAFDDRNPVYEDEGVAALVGRRGIGAGAAADKGLVHLDVFRLFELPCYPFRPAGCWSSTPGATSSPRSPSGGTESN